MAKWKIYTPEGVQDILFNECYVKRNLEEKIRGMFRMWGYYEIETPTLEFYDVFSTEAEAAPQETMFKFFDQQGRILVLRPDITIPVARLSATKYRDMNLPIRYSYIGNTFKYNELGGGKQKEITQAGVEIMGVNTPEADAEVIATAINAVKATGLENFQIDIGQVEFFKGLMEEAGLPEKDIEQIRALIDKKDFLGVEELVKEQDIREELKDLILSLPKLFGSTDVIDRMEQVTFNERSLAALENLRKVLEILEDYGLSKYVSVDLGMVRSINYYTGIIFRGFTYGVGFPILSGGRYDNLVEKFGKKCPAIGFSMGINMVMTALDRQKIDSQKPKTDSLICCQKEGRKTAFKVCQELRKQGLVIEMGILQYDIDSNKKYAAGKGIGGIINIIDSENIEIHEIETGNISKVTLTELINKNI